MIAPEQVVAAAATLDALTFGALGVLIKVTLLLCVATVLVFVLRRASAAVRHHVWLLAIVASLFVPLLAFAPGPVIRVPANWLPEQVSVPQALAQPNSPAANSPTQAVSRAPTRSMLLSDARNSASVRPSSQLNANLEELLPRRTARRRFITLKDSSGTVTEFDVRAEAVPATISTTAPTPPKKGASLNPMAIVGAMWLIGALALLTWRLIGYALLTRVIRQSVPVADKTWNDTLQNVGNGSDNTSSGNTSSVRLLQHHAFSTPVTAGWLRPVIVLPAGIGPTSLERQQAVLAHELAHIRRADFVTQGLAAFATSVFWFHPLVWFAAARLRAEGECAADDCVLTRGVDAEQYARHLLALAGRRAIAEPMPVVAMARITQLEQRLRAMLSASASRGELSRRAQRLMAAASLVVVVPGASLRVGPAAGVVAPEVSGVALTNSIVAMAKANATATLRDTSKVERQPQVPVRHSSQALVQPAIAANAKDTAAARQHAEVLRYAAVIVGQMLATTRDRVQREEVDQRNVARLLEQVRRRASGTSAGALLSPPVVRADTVIEQALPMTAGELLSLSIKSGAHVIVRGWDEPSAKLRASLGGASWWHADARMSRGPNGISINSVSEREGYMIPKPPRERGYIYLRAAGPVPIPPSVDHLIEVWVPRRTSITMNSALGDVTVYDVEGTLSGELKDGNLVLNNTKGAANVTTEFGDLRISNSVLTGEATTQCGTVTLSDVNGGIAATSRFDPAPYKALGSAGNAFMVEGIMYADYCNTRLRRLGALPNRVNESNPYGDIVIDSAPNGGTLSTGRGGKIVVRTSGGHISASNSTGNIDLSNVRGDATARSRSGDITIRLVNAGSAERHVNAQTSNGTVTIELPDSLNAMIEAVIVTTDSARAMNRTSTITDEFGFSPGASIPPDSRRFMTGRRDAPTFTLRGTLGRGTGRIYIHVTDGAIVFKRAKK